jgi:AcrR family transcriptional regulator
MVEPMTTLEPSASQRYHHGDLKPALVAAARSLLDEHGPEGLTLRQAARRVGVSQAAPYRHFRSKDALLAEVTRQGFLELRATVLAARRRRSNALDLTRAQSVAYVRFAVDNPALYRLMFGSAVRRDEHPALAEATLSAFALIEETMAAGQETGVFAPRGLRDAARTVLSCVHGLCQLLLDGQLGSLEPVKVRRITYRTVDVLLEGLVARGVGRQ